MVKEDETLTFAGELLLLIEAAPRCNCGGNCETLKFLVEQLQNPVLAVKLTADDDRFVERKREG